MNLGEPDYAFETDEVDLIVGRMWQRARPGDLLLSAWNKIICEGEKEYRFGALLTRITKFEEREAWDRDREWLEWLKPRLEQHAGFVALKRQMAATGIEGGYQGFGEYVGSATLYQFSVREEHLPALEELAQDEMGFVTPEARATAAEEFRTYMRRNFGPDAEANPDGSLRPIGISPYALHPLEERWQQDDSIKGSDWLP
jgi:hypothetical protein